MGAKKLVIVIGSLGRGGAERVISLISNYFCERGWKVWIIMLLFNKIDYDINEEIEIVDLSGSGQSRFGRLPGWLCGIRNVIHTVNPDVILSFAARINIITQLACIGLDKKIIVSERNDPYRDGRTKVIDWLTKVLYPKAHAVVFQTARAASYFKKLQLNNMVIIPNPISIQCSAKARREKRIVTVGRLTKQKNQKMLINAFAKINGEFPDYHLDIYGEGELRDSLTNQIMSLNQEDKIRLCGNVSNIHEEISDAEFFVLCSNYEGLSNALLEAMMMGIACISTNCAGSDEYIENRVTGLLIPIGDESKLYDSMKLFIKNAQLRKKCAEESKKMSVKFDAAYVLELWYKVLN